MSLGARELNRATLARQLLLERSTLDVTEAVRRVVALQAQAPASPYLALWNRLADFDPTDLDAALADRTLVKATLLRITLHVVHEDDYAPLHTAMQPTLRAARLNDRRFTASGLTIDEADALVPGLLEFAGEPRTVPELEAWVGEQIEGTPKAAWWALKSYAPLHHAPTGGPWSFGHRPSFVASGAAPTPRGSEAPDEMLTALVRRYLEGFGPASVADVAQFALVPRTRVRGALRALDGELERFEGPDGAELFDVPGGLLPGADAPAPPRLLGMWDNALLAYADRSRVVAPEYRRLVTRTNGDVLPTLLVDGYVAGVWRPVEGGIAATAFHPLPDEAWEGLAAEARGLGALLADREPDVYRRHHYWWAKLPAGDTRVLPVG